MREPWFLIALILIVLLTVWLGIAGPLPNGVAEWIHHWQPLIAATVASTVASIAAYIAFQNTSRTLRHSEELESNRRRRKHAALRAVVPLALAQISDYAEKSAHALADLEGKCVSEELPARTAPLSLAETLPSETLKTLADFIEYSDTLDVGVLESTVTSIQIHDSRLRGIVEDNHDPEGERSVLRITLEGLIIDAAAIYAGAAAGFDYARRRGSQLPSEVSWEEVRSALRNMRFWEERNPQLYVHIERFEKSSSGPFEMTGRSLIDMKI